MPLLDPPFEQVVPLEEVAAVLSDAAIRSHGGPPLLLNAAGHHLAQALSAAGFYVVRAPAADRQLTL